jgi:hypothetical protein
MHYRLSWRGLFVIAALLFCFWLPAGLSAQTNGVHAPIITSQAPTTIVAGATYQYAITATDAGNDQITYTLTTSPEGMVIAGNTISWNPTKVGTYNVVIQATDQLSGFSSQAWQVTISAAAPATIVITPDNKPTSIDLGNNQQFSAKAYDAYQNELTTTGLVWSVGKSVGTIDASGLFLAGKAGSGTITASLATATTSIDVSVKDIRKSLVTVNNTNTSSNTNTAAPDNTTSVKTNSQKNTNTATNQETITPAADTNLNSNTNTASDDAKSCTNMRRWLIIVLIILYPIILIVYFRYERRHHAGGWWLFPFFLTVIGLIIYYKYICAGTYLWWPWVLVGLGILLTWWYKGRSRSGDFDHQEKLPF